MLTMDRWHEYVPSNETGNTMLLGSESRTVEVSTEMSTPPIPASTVRWRPLVDPAAATNARADGGNKNVAEVDAATAAEAADVSKK